MKIINDKLINKIDENTSIVPLYNHKIFTKFYDHLTTSDSFYDDITFYKQNIKQNENIIELASGTGRVLIPLLKDSYKIIGIEKEREMINKVPLQYRNHVIQGNILDVDTLKKYYQNSDVFIMPATTISLFNLEEIATLLKRVTSINKKFRFIFDVIDIEELIANAPQKHINEEGTYYYANHVVKDKISYNVYHKESNTLGYSLKNNHKTFVLKEMLSNLNIKYIISNKGDYYSVFICEYCE